VLNLTFTRSTSGGSPIIGFRVQVFTVAGGAAAVAAAELHAEAKEPELVLIGPDSDLASDLPVHCAIPFPYGGLRPGTRYVFRVSAFNEIAEGPAAQSNAAAPYGLGSLASRSAAAKDDHSDDSNGDSGKGLVTGGIKVRFAEGSMQLASSQAHDQAAE
jgi:hypothetical protein